MSHGTSEHDAARVAADVPAAVHAVLVEFLTNRRSDCRAIDPDFDAAIEALERFVLGGGKRLRPVVAWWGWHGVAAHPAGNADPGDTHTCAVLRAIAALELLQACALVHDDVIDDSERRRDAPTMHMEFASRHRRALWCGDADRFGSAAAVLLGDVALAWAEDMFSTAGLEAGAQQRARPYWSAMRTEVLGGQYLDLLAQVGGSGALDDPEVPMRVNRFKTAAYTVQRPLQLGAAAGGAHPGQLESLGEFGRNVGIAFQLRDDLLGVFGDPAITGKPAGDDLREGKRTLLVAVALREAVAQGRDADARRIRGAIGTGALGDDDLAEIRRLLRDLGAEHTLKARIAELTSQAMAPLARAGLNATAQAELERLAVAATHRTR